MTVKVGEENSLVSAVAVVLMLLNDGSARHEASLSSRMIRCEGFTLQDCNCLQLHSTVAVGNKITTVQH